MDDVVKEIDAISDSDDNWKSCFSLSFSCDFALFHNKSRPLYKNESL